MINKLNFIIKCSVIFTLLLIIKICVLFYTNNSNTANYLLYPLLNMGNALLRPLEKDCKMHDYYYDRELKIYFECDSSGVILNTSNFLVDETSIDKTFIDIKEIQSFQESPLYKLCYQQYTDWYKKTLPFYKEIQSYQVTPQVAPSDKICLQRYSDKYIVYKYSWDKAHFYIALKKLKNENKTIYLVYSSDAKFEGMKSSLDNEKPWTLIINPAVKTMIMVLIPLCLGLILKITHCFKTYLILISYFCTIFGLLFFIYVNFLIYHYAGLIFLIPSCLMTFLILFNLYKKIIRKLNFNSSCYYIYTLTLTFQIIDFIVMKATGANIYKSTILNLAYLYLVIAVLILIIHALIFLFELIDKKIRNTPL